MNPYFEDDKSIIYHGDNMSVLPLLADSSVDLTVTSPPYDNLRTYNGYSFDFEGVAKELYRVTKPGGVVVWVVGDATVNGSETGTSFRQALYFKEIGFNLHDTMIYETDKPPMNDNRYQSCFEYMFVLSKGKPKTFNPIKEPCTYAGSSRASKTYRKVNGELQKTNGEKFTLDSFTRRSIWYFISGASKGTLDNFVFTHPATFPESLANDHIRSWSNPGDTILDPFCGSGTTLKMARKNGCKSIGIEISAEYCDIAVRRISQGVFNFEEAIA